MKNGVMAITEFLPSPTIKNTKNKLIPKRMLNILTKLPVFCFMTAVINKKAKIMVVSKA